MILLSPKLLVTILMLTAFTSCSSNKHIEKQELLDPNTFAFVEYIQTQEGEVLEGKVPPGRRIDGPAYRFDKETKKLELLSKVNFSFDTVKIILGNGKILKGASGSGLSMRINAIGKLPYSMYNLTITEISSKGIRLLFDKREILLMAGEEWKSSTISIDTIKSEPRSIIKTNTTNTIRFTGKLSKSSLHQQ